MDSATAEGDRKLEKRWKIPKLDSDCGESAAEAFSLMSRQQRLRKFTLEAHHAQEVTS